MRIERTIDVDASPVDVWAILEDVERWPEWTASMTSVKRRGVETFGMGSEVRVKQPRLPATTLTVTSFEPGREFTWETSGRGVRTVASHRVEPREGDRAKAVLAIEHIGPLSALMRPLISGITRRYVEMEAEGLKRRAEERSKGTS